ncbi:isoprenylcysteine carboxylmethyltransferase family protein [Mesorhizobium sp. CA18]|uniref:methyltransferase family protein n=1 Tax=unclassified Mesorhizobium TaxID=325217 RepID=UPI001CC97FD5|nr:MULTISPECIES: isoprenylcysteine carboxylmethyltransferase family protein [unclassified Mesorhizobium]MBZ9734405.1 isoprenylcysteine carboxylmethyltransferase family protein [Mesorhizobium sp. CA9]MBZ9824686.1 isoprenylcysteine carboxylmethyltransferase family protein [Mesorhizobium sp. CA18]MBZ9829356.1 isoprenylcysteine carboxylmethyltransferase family protein [Mesorhizobium sp. CA2]MBZ9837074.1 isoprenylcysteine carboxylmethyltransferase family protein [Mesorhizobium sp. CA3]MBZ9878054.1 
MAIVAVMTVLATLSAISLAEYFWSASYSITLAMVTQLSSVIFLLLQLFMTVARLPAQGTAKGIEPRVTSVAGTFLILVAMMLIPPVQSWWVQLSALCTILLGTSCSIFCISWLGRSFSLMATARRLVTSGPYSVVRHPLYICEAVFVLGIIISHFSWLMVALGFIQCIFQYRRATNEEAILRETFPEYDEYARRVPMLVPRFFRSPEASTQQ